MASVLLAVGKRPEFLFGDNLPFGHELVSAFNDNTLTHYDQKMETDDLVRNIRLAAEQLNTSSDPADMAMLRSLERGFNDVSKKLVGSQGTRAIMPNFVQWLCDSSLGDIVTFCLNNVEHYNIQKELLDGLHPKLKVAASQAVSRLVSLQALPEIAGYELEIAMKRQKSIKPMDTIDALAINAVGQFTNNGSRHTAIISLARPEHHKKGPYSQAEQRELASVYLHEICHSACCGTGSGYTWGEGGPESRLLEEVSVEHVTQVGMSKDPLPEVLNPELRGANEPGYYFHERRFMALVAASGRYAVDAVMIMRGLFATETNGLSFERNEMLRMLDANIRELMPEYAESGFAGLSAAYEGTLDTHSGSALTEKWHKELSQRLSVPVVESPEPVLLVDKIFGPRRVAADTY